MPIKREPLFPFREALICSKCGEVMTTAATPEVRRWPREEPVYYTHFCINGHSTSAVERYPRQVFYTQNELDEIQRNEEERARRGE